MAEELEDRTTADMLGILRASLFTGEDLSVPEWEPVFEEMKAQTVAALPARWLPHHLEAPQWARYCTRVQGQWVRVMHAQDQLLRLLEEHHIPCVILKGFRQPIVPQIRDGSPTLTWGTPHPNEGAAYSSPRDVVAS